MSKAAVTTLGLGVTLTGLTDALTGLACFIVSAIVAVVALEALAHRLDGTPGDLIARRRLAIGMLELGITWRTRRPTALAIWLASGADGAFEPIVARSANAYGLTPDTAGRFGRTGAPF